MRHENIIKSADESRVVKDDVDNNAMNATMEDDGDNVSTCGAATVAISAIPRYVRVFLESGRFQVACVQVFTGSKVHQSLPEVRKVSGSMCTGIYR